MSSAADDVPSSGSDATRRAARGHVRRRGSGLDVGAAARHSRPETLRLATPAAEQDDAADVSFLAEQPSSTSVGKALSILEILAACGMDDVSMTDIARAAHVPKSTAHRLLKTLEVHGYVEQSGPLYRLGAQFFSLARYARRPFMAQLQNAAGPVLERLFERTGETVHLAVQQGGEVVYLEKITAPGGSRLPSRVGGSMPLTCTGLGKAMLAFSSAELIAQCLDNGLTRATPYSVRRQSDFVKQLVEVRRTVVAYDIEESCLGMTCVAAPVIREQDGYAVGAISVAGPTARFRPQRAATLVLEAARKISANAFPRHD